LRCDETHLEHSLLGFNPTPDELLLIGRCSPSYDGFMLAAVNSTRAMVGGEAMDQELKGQVIATYTVCAPGCGGFTTE
jgi:hypothetical protein